MKKTTQNKQLTVYKASAGSGKTFNLAIEYIMILIQNPYAFKNILAVTFTNKATEEMKNRILGQLYGIAHELTSSDSYMQEIIARRQKRQLKKLQKHEIRAQAATALHNLLHNYSYFRVETIDSFFQHVLKNLAKELDLTPNFNIDLDDNIVIEKAVDDMIDNLHKDATTKKQIIQFIEESLEEDKGWDVRRKIKDFAKNITKDIYKDNKTAINACTEEIFTQTTKELKTIIKEYDDTMRQYALRFEKDFADYEFKKKNNISLYYKKIKDKKEYTNKKLLTNYVTDTLENKDAIAHLLTVECETYRTTHYPDYITAKSILEHIGQLALLKKIEEHVQIINHEQNRFMLNDTQHLLQTMIDGNDASFIYEKIGTQLKHIMIDEFQDTSIVQWKNFKVLIDECIAHEDGSALIVGDIKQSIYRWRSGDWRLLHNIENEYPNNINIETLDENFRSQGNIIDFNNKFFAKAIENQTEEIKSAYSDVEQKIHKLTDKGLVRITFVQKTDDDDDPQVTETYNTIKYLLENNIKYNQIAILARNNSVLKSFAQWFAKHHPDIPILSKEAYELSASTSVNIIINAITYIARHDDVAREYIKQNCNEYYEEFITQSEKIATLPLYEMAERIYSILHIDSRQGESEFICTIFDKLMEFVNNNPATPETFIKYWEEKLETATIQETSTNGIRLMTIHKSKGLEFDNVIIPHCDWKINTNSQLWLSTEGKEHFEQLPVITINAKTELEHSHFAAEYKDELLQISVDNLNTLYVALTRATNNLFLICDNKVATNRINDILRNAMPNMNEVQENVYEKGSLYIAPETKENKENDKNVFTTPEENIKCYIKHYDAQVEFKQSNRSNYFLSTQKQTDDHDNNRERGLLLHDILSNIKYIDNKEEVLNKYEQNGMFSATITRQDAEKVIDDCMGNEKMKEWFSHEWKICNERDIIENSTKHRCDRIVYKNDETIVIDFKFGQPHPAHDKQVKTYIGLLKQIGFKNVHGYLWYAEDKRTKLVL